MKKLFLGVFSLALLFTSCSNDDDNNVITTTTLTYNFLGLEDLGNGFAYEGWIIVNGTPVSTGTFTVAADGTLSTTSAQIDTGTLNSATTFVLTIEPSPDNDPLPSAQKLLAGDFNGNTANVNSSIVGDFSASQGAYILATPTDNDDTNEESGVWFLDNSSGSAVAGLNLPALDEGWKYEGWVVFDGVPISTGTFSDPAMADDNAATSPYKGDAGNGPGYPGEDYLQNAPSGLTFPTDLKGRTIVISVEPSPDNSALPFTLKPLAHTVPDTAPNHTTISMGAGPVMSLTGTVTR